MEAIYVKEYTTAERVKTRATAETT